MNRRTIAGLLLSALWLGGCASLDARDRVSLAERIATEHRFSRLDIQTSRFNLAAFVGPQKGSGILHVYIEGDGFAWVTRNRPSRNPTPLNPVALKLAVLDGHDVAYVARPCQYVSIDEQGCNRRYWTSARFSGEVVEAMDDAISQLKQRVGAKKLVLIGYSGGGAIAALVAARRSDVIHLVTVAGNLDPAAWARWHAIPELHGSLNPKEYRSALAEIQQTHFVGESDNVVPIEIYRSYRQAFPEHSAILVKLVPKADHGCCWDSVWPSLLKELP